MNGSGLARVSSYGDAEAKVHVRGVDHEERS
jgi:hypothetical protein